jgi:PhzF family phenazine biosynthesis protein
MPTLPFQQVDVFTAVPFRGNPVAVVLDAAPLATEEAQAIACWTNLSETTFVCPPTHPDADYRLRIFTPRRELAFAGHPTIGSAHAVLRHGLKPRTPARLVQECGKGLVPLQIDEDSLLLALPAPAHREPTRAERGQVADALGLGPADILRASIVDVGPVWFTVQVASGAAVVGLAPDMARLSALAPLGVTGVTVFGLYPDGPPDLEVRSFAPAAGIPEDPVCGSGNGCVAAMVQRNRLLAGSRYHAAQGRSLGRDGRVEVRFAPDGAIWLGGQAVACVEGTIRVSEETP